MKISGLDSLVVSIKAKGINSFKKKVKEFITEITSYREHFIKIQKDKLSNRNINDGKTDFPHYRTGNLYNKLVDLKIERYDPKKFTHTKSIVKYTHSSTNMLEDGKSGFTSGNVYVNRNGKIWYYAKYLESAKRVSRYNGYFGRLQTIFSKEYSLITKKIFKIK